MKTEKKVQPAICCPTMEKFQADNPDTKEGLVLDSGDGTWNLNGCCRGHCFVMTLITHCPFCGKPLKLENQG